MVYILYKKNMFFFKFRHHFLQETYLPLLRVGC